MKWLFLTVLFLLPASVSYSAEQIKIAILDTGIDLADPRFSFHACPGMSQDFTGQGLRDVHGHGTHITGLIEKYARNKNYCFFMVKYTNGYLSQPQDFVNAINYLTTVKFDILNFSGGGDNYQEFEYQAFKHMPRVKIFAAAGNDGRNIDHIPFYPASYDLDNIVIVSAVDNDGKPTSFTNWSKKSAWEIGDHILSTFPYSLNKDGMGFMSGTSQATAIETGKYVYENY